jgi:hypothetical protein
MTEAEAPPRHPHGWNLFSSNGIAYRVWVAKDGAATRLDRMVGGKGRAPYWRAAWLREPGVPAKGKAAKVLRAGGFTP